MKTITTIGIDLAKNIYAVHGNDKNGKCVLRRNMSRKKLFEFIAQLKPCLIGMEACGGSNYFARKFKGYGHEVKLIAPQYVKGFVRGNKNDLRDSEAIADAVERKNIKAVPIKTAAQQDIQSIHRVRQRLMKNRTALGNEIRGLGYEYGVRISRGLGKLRKELPIILGDAENELTDLIRSELQGLYEELVGLDRRILEYDAKIHAIFMNNEVCQRVAKISGVGELTATAIVSAMGEAMNFKNGREFSAWLGLVPKQHGSGGKVNLGGISKRGDKYLRMLLIHGARSSLQVAKKRQDKVSQWALQVQARRGKYKAYVALANKNARMIWAVIAKDTEYKLAV